MSVAEATHRPAKAGRAVKLWLGFILIIAAGIGLAWIGAGKLRPETTPSGLQFRTLKAGKGEPIAQTDAALLDYILSANDGSAYDSSDQHGGAQPFYIDMPTLYPGFAEAMARMQEGGEYRFTMPEKLGWGAGKAPPGWPKGSPLTFEVRVRKIVPGGAALLQQQMIQQMQQQQQAPQQQAPQQ